ncbi:MAG TPA: DUF6485 family protein [Candidatus Gastranaerophilaceae bacterium]|nr:DUF6485 family protein [Candidatus Gastranaerophilaceae bacterium]
MECKKEENKINCTCTYSCSKKGICCDCVAYHRQNGEIPGCFFPASAEKTYDRSIANFIRSYQR